MIRLSPNGLDSEIGRALTAAVALAGLAVTFVVEDKKKYAYVFANFLSILAPLLLGFFGPLTFLELLHLVKWPEEWRTK